MTPKTAFVKTAFVALIVNFIFIFLIIVALKDYADKRLIEKQAAQQYIEQAAEQEIENCNLELNYCEQKVLDQKIIMEFIKDCSIK